MSSSESSSSSPEPDIRKSTKKLKDKRKTKAASGVSKNGKNEGVDPHWDYKPPEGVSLLQRTEDAGEFDWDNIANNEDLELWLIRVPEGVRYTIYFLPLN